MRSTKNASSAAGATDCRSCRPRLRAWMRCSLHDQADRNEIVAHIAPGFGAATVERIAINAVMAGCRPEYLPVLLAAVEAVADREIQSAGHPGDDQFGGAVDHRQRSARGDAGRQRGTQLPGPGQSRERDARPRAAPRAAEYRRRAARRDGPRDPWPARQVHVLLRRERSGQSVAAAARRARIQRG